MESEESPPSFFPSPLGEIERGFPVSYTHLDVYKRQAKYFQYGAHNAANSHLFEAQIGYDFGPVAVNWYTNFAGDDGVDKDGDRAYSSYISVAAPFTLGGLDWTAEIGATPLATDFYGANGFVNTVVACKVGVPVYGYGAEIIADLRLEQM